MVDLETFQQLMDALTRLQELVDDEDEAAWIMQVVNETRVYRQAHPDEVMTFDSPEAIFAVLDTLNV